MSARQLSQIVVLAFVVIGVLAASARHQAREKSQTAQADSLWRLTYDITFETDLNVEKQDSAAVVTIGQPFSTAFVEVVSENIVNPDSSLRVKLLEKIENSASRRFMPTNTMSRQNSI